MRFTMRNPVFGIYIGLDTQSFQRKSVFFSNPSVLAYVLGAKKNRLIGSFEYPQHMFWLRNKFFFGTHF